MGKLINAGLSELSHLHKLAEENMQCPRSVFVASNVLQKKTCLFNLNIFFSMAQLYFNHHHARIKEASFTLSEVFKFAKCYS